MMLTIRRDDFRTLIDIFILDGSGRVIHLLLKPPSDYKFYDSRLNSFKM